VRLCKPSFTAALSAHIVDRLRPHHAASTRACAQPLPRRPRSSKSNARSPSCPATSTPSSPSCSAPNAASSPARVHVIQRKLDLDTCNRSLPRSSQAPSRTSLRTSNLAGHSSTSTQRATEPRSYLRSKQYSLSAPSTP
jgi:hypothetical protein